MMTTLLDHYDKTLTVNKWEPAVRLVLACEGLTCPVGRFSVIRCHSVIKTTKENVICFAEKPWQQKSKQKTWYFLTNEGWKLPVFFKIHFVRKVLTFWQVNFPFIINTLHFLSLALSKEYWFFLTNLWQKFF